MHTSGAGQERLGLQAGKNLADWEALINPVNTAYCRRRRRSQVRCKSLLLSMAGATVVFLSFVSQSLPGFAEASPQNDCQPLAVARIAGAVDDNVRISLPGNVHPMARAEFDLG
ncbi:MAG: hypothetical protein ABSD20_15500, partial [Terriglobales bacterium]